MPINDNLPKKPGDARRVNSPTGWVVGGVFVVVMILILFFYSGRGSYEESGANPPNVVTQSQPHK